MHSQQQQPPNDQLATAETNAPSALRQKGHSAINRVDHKNQPRSSSGQKRRFGAAGILNVLLTNVVLQCLLATSVVTVTIATLISQVVNACLGYTIYGKLVFRAKGLRHHQPLLRYLILMTALWLLNAGGIEAGKALGMNRNLAAAALIPCLAIVSFTIQKYMIFRQ